MTVPVQTPIISYVGNGISTLFAFPFAVLLSEDLKVLVDGVTQTIGSGYSINGIGNANGGSVQFNTPPAAGAKIVFFRDISLERDTDYQDNGDLLATTVNADFDRIWMALQDVGADASRAIRYPVTEYTKDGTLPSVGDRANMILAFDGSGDQMMMPMPSTVGAGDLLWEKGSDGTRGFKAGVDYTIGVTTELTLSRNPGSEANCWVYWGAAPQTDFTIGDHKVIFPTPILSDRVDVRTGTTLSVGVPPQGSVTDDTVASGAAIDSSKLSFLQSGTGALRRTVFAKLTDVVSVKDFGAKGDGTTDDTAAAIAAHATGRLVYYPGGVYKLTPFSIAAGGIVGDGQGETILNFADTSGNDLITYTGTGNNLAIPLFRDFSIYSTLSKTNGSALRFDASSGQLSFPYILDVRILNAPGGIRFTDTGMFVVDGCNIQNYGGSKGIWIENTFEPDGGDSVISNCFINTSVPTGSTFGIWYRSGGGLKVVNTKILGGDSCFVLGFNSATKNVADLLISNCSFENALQFGIFLGRDSGAFSFGSVLITGTEIACSSGIQSDGSGFLTLLVIDSHIINLTSTSGAGIVLNNLANFRIGPGIINAQAGAGSTVGISTTSSCSNGKISAQTFVGIPAGNRVSNGSSTVVYEEVSQTGAVPAVTTSTAYGPIYTGTVAVTFPEPFAVAPASVSINGGSINGGFGGLAGNISTTGFTAQLFGVTNGGVVSGATYSTKGGVI